MIDVCLLGTGGVMPLPDRALTSLYVCNNGRAVLIDCGEGTQTAVRRAGRKFSRIEAILITHFHADHMSGLPGLLLTLGLEGRTEPLDMYGPVGLEYTVSSLRVIAAELTYDIRFHEIDTEAEPFSFSCAGLDAVAFPVDHGMPCLGYRFELARKPKFDTNRAKEKGIPTKFWGKLQGGQSVGGFEPSDVLGEPRKGISFLYATDTRPVPEIELYGKNADLMILEGMFGDGEKQERAEETHHMMMWEAAKIARDSEASELWLTHYSPAMAKPAEYSEMLSGIFENTVICEDGHSAALSFKD